uniref:Uncharacterized protein n=1 Tax=Trichuris muris TaxID=70415 RepID=A0A5S6QGX8_TRIMR
MKLTVHCILPLFLVLIGAEKDDSTAEENEELMGNLTATIRDILPSPKSQGCKRQIEEWAAVEKEAAAKAVFETLLKLLPSPSQFTFVKLIGGGRCSLPGGPITILNLKLRRTVNATKKLFKLVSNKPKDVYCSWIGVLENGMHKMMKGAVCYRSKTTTEKDEEQLAKADVCNDWKYAETNLHRLVIPKNVSSWGTDFLIYYPPATDTTYYKVLAAQKIKFPVEYLNPSGRTGLTGQGHFRALGENKMEAPIILRLYKGQRQILLSTYHKEGIKGPVAMFYRKPKDSAKLLQWKEPSAAEYFYTLLDEQSKAKCPIKEISDLMKGARKLYNGHIPHPYETDNAWVKAKIFMILATEEPCLFDLDLNSEANHLKYQWKTYNDSTLRSVENVVNALFTKEVSKAVVAGSYISAVDHFFYFITAAAVISMFLGSLGTTYERSWVFIRENINTC